MSPAGPGRAMDSPPSAQPSRPTRAGVYSIVARDRRKMMSTPIEFPTRPAAGAATGGRHDLA